LVDVGIDSIFNQIINKEKGDIKLWIFLLNYTYNFYIFKDINKNNISNYSVNNSTKNKVSIYNSNASIVAYPIGIINQKED
jgi:hypothetical protein